ncbi:hypothetical protein VTL71DRAFT_6699 [Oculimacula yallundae]|uniref:Uncharacterized protein n=1 Tax=Oculimacula yallundae TaxID=86028 RepID=A0ABR4BXS4_9HELO
MSAATLKSRGFMVDCTNSEVSNATEYPDTEEINLTSAIEFLALNMESAAETDVSKVSLRVLTIEIPALKAHLRLTHTMGSIPFELITHMAESPHDFQAVWQNNAGSSTLLDSPRRLLIQTPYDGEMFCSIVVRTTLVHEERGGRGPYRQFRAVVIVSDPSINLEKFTRSYSTPTNWNNTYLPMVVLPLGFLQQHVYIVSETLMKLMTEISAIETTVLDDDNTKAEDLASSVSGIFKGLIKRLHLCSRDAVQLRRRWHFQITLAESIIELIESHDPQVMANRKAARNEYVIMGNVNVDTNSWVNFGGPAENQVDGLIESREYQQLLSVASLQLKLSQSLEYDLDTLPIRITNQFNAIFNLMTQHDTQASMSLAKSSKKDSEYMAEIAAATLRDSSSVKTIAVMTMVFLPGTFICSFFSMTMFNWNKQPGERLVSPYIWVYFVAMLPLTMLVIAVWWWRTKESRREQEQNQKIRLERRNTLRAKV